MVLSIEKSVLFGATAHKKYQNKKRQDMEVLVFQKFYFVHSYLLLSLNSIPVGNLKNVKLQIIL